MKQPKLTDSIDPTSVVSIEELWKILEKTVETIIEDNQQHNGEYPLKARQYQMELVRTIVHEIEKFHKKFGDGDKNDE